MATTIPAMKGKIGSTEYFVLAMKAKLLTEKAVIPSEMTEWHDMSVEERAQREINYKRVTTQIAPYLARDKDRFFGSIVLEAKNFDPKEDFEPISAVAKEGLPRLYKKQTEQMGYVTLQDEVVLIPLDGQHRVKALDFAIKGTDDEGKPISGLSPNLALAKEDITVIIIPENEAKSRKIFTKINRYAKPTTTGENLVTDDDDIVAVLSRMVANDKSIIGARLVNYKDNKLGDNMGYFTTLTTIAECNAAILEANFPGRIDRTVPVEDSNKRALYEEKVTGTWKFLAKSINLFADCLRDKKESGDAKRMEIRKDYLLGKPMPQVCLVSAFARLTNLPQGQGRLPEEAAAKKLNAIDWRKESELWDRVLISGTRIFHNRKPLIINLLCYLAGEPLDSKKKATLLAKYRECFSDEERKGKQLPKPK